jgi:hypothetical protein
VPRVAAPRGLWLQPWQWGVLALVYVAAFLLPAVWMARRARRDGDDVLAWTALVLVGSALGILEYFEHRAIVRRRSRRGER